MTNLMLPRASFVGFDRLFDQLERATQHQSNPYPPHNIIRLTETSYTIEMAVAGFSMSDIDIEVERRSLKVSGAMTSRDREYVHKGISEKKFNRTFNLADHVEVTSATLENGILSLNLEIVVPEELKPRKISINDKSPPPEFLTEEDNCSC